MFIVDDLLEVAYIEWRASELIDLEPLLLLVLLLRLESFLVLDELFLHQQVVLDALLSEQAEPALRNWVHLWELGACINATLLLLSSDSRWSCLLSALL